MILIDIYCVSDGIEIVKNHQFCLVCDSRSRASLPVMFSFFPPIAETDNGDRQAYERSKKMFC